MNREILEIEEGSPLDYDELVVYIMAREKSLAGLVKHNKKFPPKESYTECCNDLEIALLHKEEGPEKMRIKFLEGVQNQEYDLDNFIRILKKAKKKLMT